MTTGIENGRHFEYSKYRKDQWTEWRLPWKWSVPEGKAGQGWDPRSFRAFPNALFLLFSIFYMYTKIISNDLREEMHNSRGWGWPWMNICWLYLILFTLAVTHPITSGLLLFVSFYVSCFPVALIFPQLQVWLLKIICFCFCTSVTRCITILHLKLGATLPVGIYISWKWFFLGSPLSLRKLSQSLVASPKCVHLLFIIWRILNAFFFKGYFVTTLKRFSMVLS